MKPVQKYKAIVVEIICSLLIVLFTYAAVSKLLDLAQFRAQLEQSPLLSVFADYDALGLPVLEILIALLFFSSKSRFLGLWVSFSILVIFSVYIIFVLNFADAIPCSCGGVIASLSWSQQLLFNIGFALLPNLEYPLFKNPLKIKNEGSLVFLRLTKNQ